MWNNLLDPNIQFLNLYNTDLPKYYIITYFRSSRFNHIWKKKTDLNVSLGQLSCLFLFLVSHLNIALEDSGLGWCSWPRVRICSNTTFNLPLPEFGPQRFSFQGWFSVRNSQLVQCKLEVVKEPFNVRCGLGLCANVLYVSGISGVGDDKCFYTQTGA